MSPRVFNYLLYEVGWCACVLGAAWVIRGSEPASGWCRSSSTSSAPVAVATRSLLTLWTAASVSSRLGADRARHAAIRGRDARAVAAAALARAGVGAVRHDVPLRPRVAEGPPGSRGLVRSIGGPLAFLARPAARGRRAAPEVWPSLLSLAVGWSVAIPAAVWGAERQSGREGVAGYRGGRRGRFDARSRIRTPRRQSVLELLTRDEPSGRSLWRGKIDRS
jgi:hypothetical protein